MKNFLIVNPVPSRKKVDRTVLLSFQATSVKRVTDNTIDVTGLMIDGYTEDSLPDGRKFSKNYQIVGNQIIFNNSEFEIWESR